MSEFERIESDEQAAAREAYEDAVNEGKGIAADEIERLTTALLSLLATLGQHEQPADVIAACEAASAALIKSGRVMG